MSRTTNQVHRRHYWLLRERILALKKSEKCFTLSLLCFPLLHVEIIMLFHTPIVWFGLNFLCVAFTLTFRITSPAFQDSVGSEECEPLFLAPLVFVFYLESKLACKRKVCQKILTQWSRSAHFMRVLSCPQSPKSCSSF